MAKNENGPDQVVFPYEVIPPVAKPTFFQKHKVAVVAVIAFVAGAAAEAITAGFMERKQLNLVDSSDPLVEISEPTIET